MGVRRGRVRARAHESNLRCSLDRSTETHTRDTLDTERQADRARDRDAPLFQTNLSMYASMS